MHLYILLRILQTFALPFPALLFEYNICCVKSKFCLMNTVHMILITLNCFALNNLVLYLGFSCIIFIISFIRMHVHLLSVLNVTYASYHRFEFHLDLV